MRCSLPFLASAWPPLHVCSISNWLLLSDSLSYFSIARSIQGWVEFIPLHFLPSTDFFPSSLHPVLLRPLFLDTFDFFAQVTIESVVSQPLWPFVPNSHMMNQSPYPKCYSGCTALSWPATGGSLNFSRPPLLSLTAIRNRLCFVKGCVELTIRREDLPAWS